MTSLLLDPIIWHNYFYANIIMVNMTLPQATREEEERLRCELRLKLKECILAVKEPVLRRQLRILASAHGILDLSTLFPAQPITESPIEEAAITVAPLIDALLSMTRSQATKFFRELIRVARTPEGIKKYGRSDDYLRVFEDAGLAMEKLAVKVNSNLRQDVSNAVSKVDGENLPRHLPSPPSLPPEKPVFGP